MKIKLYELRHNQSVSVLILLIVFCVSCGVPKDVVYFQNLADSEQISTNSAVVTRYKPLDILGITVSAPDPEAAIPFNGGVASLNEGDTSSSGSGTVNTGSKYFVDANGMIEFPIIGSLKVAGLSNIEVKELIKEKLKTYIKDPSVAVQLKNFKVTIIGEVKNPGPINIENEQVTIIEAIGMAGDLDIQGKRTNIKVIRKEGDTQVVHTVDLTSKDIFNSSVYYLNQNDLVYVEPNDSKARLSRTSNWPRVLTSVSSILGIIISVIVLTR